MPSTTRDALFEGRLALTQPARGAGYRVNVDAILLAAFASGRIGSPAAERKPRIAFDLGAGVGAVGLSLLYFGSASRIVMVESDDAIAKLACANVEANGFGAVAEVLAVDVTAAAVDRAGEASLVVCNPPYFPPGRGSLPAPARARARSGALEIFTTAARALAGRRARVCFVYPAIEATTLLHALRRAGLEPKRLCAVHGTASVPARVVLVESVAGKPGGLSLEAPFVETDARGHRSPALAKLLSS